MILIDLSQTLYSVLIQNQKEYDNAAMARGMIFTTLLSYKKQFYKDYGAPVICMDSKVGYWRKEVFEHYKAGRKKDRDNSKIDWERIFEIVNEVTEEIPTVVPWKCVRVDMAEADDVIACLTMEYRNDNDILILSSDKDYKQLHTTPRVVQYSSIMKRWIKTEDPAADLQELILEGDRGDGIPNVRSDADCFVTGKRQSPVTAKFKKEFQTNPARLYREVKERYDLNEQLIDFSKIPDEIRRGVLEEFKKPVQGSIQKLYNYFVRNRLPRILSDVELFKVKATDYDVREPNEFFQ